MAGAGEGHLVMSKAGELLREGMLNRGGGLTKGGNRLDPLSAAILSPGRYFWRKEATSSGVRAWHKLESGAIA